MVGHGVGLEMKKALVGNLNKTKFLYIILSFGFEAYLFTIDRNVDLSFVVVC